MRLYYISLVFLFVSASCAPKVLILQSPVISMKKVNAGSAKDLKESKSVEEKWCASDDPVQVNDDGSKHYGMIDQVVWKAHRDAKADFFVNSRFYQQGNCVLMSATAASGGNDSGGEGEGAAPAKSEGSPAPNKKKKKGSK